MKNVELFDSLSIEESISIKKGSMKGIYPSQQIRALVKDKFIFSDGNDISENQIQPASLDLRLGSKAYHVKASFLPNASKVMTTLKDKKLIVDEIDLEKGATLQKHCVYIIPIKEKVKLPKNISAKANPRSTVGRLDIFVRLLSDYTRAFDFVMKGYEGDLYVEVVPRTFSIKLYEGMCLNQVRFITGDNLEFENDKKLKALDRKKNLVYSRHEESDQNVVSEPSIWNGLRLSVDLWGDYEGDLVGFKAQKNTPAIDFGKVNTYDPKVFWEPILSKKNKVLILEPDDFFILTSKQRVRIPLDYAAEMVAFEPTMGELRVHYAGFFDPGFGYGNEDGSITGTPAVMEIRAYGTPYLLEDNQLIANLRYYTLIDKSDKVYGPDIGSSYQFQKLTLSKQFKRFEE